MGKKGAEDDLSSRKLNGRGKDNAAAADGTNCRIRLPAKREKPTMPKKPGTNPKGEFAFFDVLYEDGSQRSNRRVPSELLGGLEGDEPARGFIMEQDREIAEKSGRPPLAISSIERTGAKKKKKDLA